MALLQIAKTVIDQFPTLLKVCEKHFDSMEEIPETNAEKVFRVQKKGLPKKDTLIGVRIMGTKDNLKIETF